MFGRVWGSGQREVPAVGDAEGGESGNGFGEEGDVGWVRGVR
jgi:hypothetical protein